jgi:hypothetical protein
VSLAQIVLLVAGASVGLFYGVPLLFVPIHWSRAFRWKAPADLRLARYFGRCLGAGVLVLCAVALVGAFQPEHTRLALGACALMLALQGAIHVVGMLEKAQPWTETVEGFVWLAMALGFAALLLR